MTVYMIYSEGLVKCFLGYCYLTLRELLWQIAVVEQGGASGAPPRTPARYARMRSER